MTTTLKWPRRSRFVDRDANVDVTGPDATAEVPDDAVDRYLSRGWEHVEASEAADDGDEPADDQDTGTSSDNGGDTQDAGEEASAADGDGDDAAADATDSSGSDAEPEEAFDAEAFVSRHWNAVAKGITDGEADGHLQAVEEAERARGDDDGMRDSVATALEDRRAETGA